MNNVLWYYPIQKRNENIEILEVEGHNSFNLFEYFKI